MNEMTVRSDESDTMNRLIRQQIQVRYDYPVVFTRDVFSLENNTLPEILLGIFGDHPSPAAALYIDKALVGGHPGLELRATAFLRQKLPRLQVAFTRTLAGGERLKSSPLIVDQLIDEMAAARLDRHSAVLVVGGGAVLDTVGYAASLVHRGLKVIRLPTTVLSQNDGGVGVKTAVNHAAGKNFLGTFAPPAAVINDFNFLRSLPDHEWRAGIAEAFKVALIKDAAFFDWLCDAACSLRNREEAAMEQLVFRCAELHLQHIRESGDPFETGTARPLDFGHWLAHELELMSGYQLGHGAAVAIGIAVDSLYAESLALISSDTADRLLRGLMQSGFELWHEALEHVEADGSPVVLAGLEKFREHLGGKLCITLPSGPGRRVEVNEIGKKQMAGAIQRLRERVAALDC